MRIPELKPVPGYDGYFVTVNGDVWSTNGRHNKSRIPKILKPFLHGKHSKSDPVRHYRTVSLCVDKKLIRKTVAYLMLITFVGPRPKGMIICHGLNGQQDDSLANLSWGTYEKNNGPDKIRDGTLARGERIGTARLTEEKVRLVLLLSENGFTNRQIADKLQIGHATVSSINRKQTWRHIT